MDLPHELAALIESVTANRPRTVLRHILEHGHITTEELAEQYGYNHPPRAARDVREQGIPLRMERIRGRSGRSIARYTIDVEEFERRRARMSEGRRAFPAAWKRTLTTERGYRCEVCLTTFQGDIDLQVDHRVPYEIGGDPPLSDTTAFMIVCPSCNREKSWRCEHCPNWVQRETAMCQNCFWANPSAYSHVAMAHHRAMVLTFGEGDEDLYQLLVKESREQGVPLSDLVKGKLKTTE